MLDVASLLAELVRFDTTAPKPGSDETPDYIAALKWLEARFQEIGCVTQLIHLPESVAGNGRFNLTARLPRPGKPKAFIYTHVDVVPAGTWKGAFIPRIENGRVFGRGASDMKSGIIAAMAGLDLLKNRDTTHDITVLVTTDEETDQANQLRYLFDYLSDTTGSIGGSLLLDVDTFCGGVDVACLGAYQFDIAVFGKAAHSASPHLGRNAIEDAMHLGTHLMILQSLIRTRVSSIRAEPGSGIEFMKPTLSIDMIRGGSAANQIPDVCTLTVDRRFIPEENPEDVVRELKDFLAATPLVQYEIRNETLFQALKPRDYPENDQLLETVRQVTGSGDKFGVLGSGEIVEISDEFGLRMVGTGAIRPENNIHGENEFVYVRDVENLALIIERFFGA